MKLIHMAHKAGEGECLPQPMVESEYPYGLKLTLNEAQLEALGLEFPEAGKELHLEARAVVTKASTEDPDADGDVDFVCVDLQLTHLGVEDGEEKEEPENKVERRERAASRLY